MDHSQELSFAKNLAHEAGKVMLKYFYEDIEVEMKDNVTPLTIADTTINQMVIDAIKKNYPTHGMIGEEGNGGAENAEYIWICDPIDGTIPYTIKFPTSMFSLALYKNKKPILGVLYDPYTDKMYTALEGGPAYCNDKIINVKNGKLQKGDVVGIINMFGKNRVIDYSDIVQKFNKDEIRTEEIHCLVYFAAAVADGRMKCAFTPGAHAWDRAASLIIARAAGGRVTDEKGDHADTFIDSQKLVFSNGDIHEEILRMIDTK